MFESLFNRGVDLCNVGGQRNVSLFLHCPPALSRRYRNYESDIGSRCWLYGVFCMACLCLIRSLNRFQEALATRCVG
ncbi:hypothetical protein [Candidatus Ichthyocystis sparus]|uniref:hypothetical protein n=1 Tax=Candidatus Ichthyocystis sparus TaxID=1561004 RepID=UPI0011478507|nr:hypothetical protein [Candidatus Ichthyocystis sparus]